jgi:hypothetical protein
VRSALVGFRAIIATSVGFLAVAAASDAQASRSLLSSLDTRHVYVSAGRHVDRFSLVDGVINPKPDLRYGGTFDDQQSGSIAIGPGGDLYAKVSSWQVARFPFGSTLPTSTLNVGSPRDSIRVGTPAVDRHGFLYLTYSKILNGQQLFGVFVYGPFAKNNVKPLHNVALPTQLTFLFGLAFNSSGDLYVSSQAANGIYVYMHPETDPILTRTITSNSITSPQGIAIDGQDELFVMNHGSATIGAFRDTAGRDAIPDRVISLGSEPWVFYGGMSLFGNDLFVPTVQGYVCELDKRQGSPELPLATLRYYANDVRVGL